MPLDPEVTLLLCVNPTFDSYQTILSVALALPGLVLIVLCRKKGLMATSRLRKPLMIIGIVLLLLGLNIYCLVLLCR